MVQGFFCKPPRKLLAGQVDQSETTEDPKMLEPVVPEQASGHDVQHQAFDFVEALEDFRASWMFWNGMNARKKTNITNM